MIPPSFIHNIIDSSPYAQKPQTVSPVLVAKYGRTLQRDTFLHRWQSKSDHAKSRKRFGRRRTWLSIYLFKKAVQEVCLMFAGLVTSTRYLPKLVENDLFQKFHLIVQVELNAPRLYRMIKQIAFQNKTLEPTHRTEVACSFKRSINTIDIVIRDSDPEKWKEFNGFIRNNRHWILLPQNYNEDIQKILSTPTQQVNKNAKYRIIFLESEMNTGMRGGQVVIEEENHSSEGLNFSVTTLVFTIEDAVNTAGQGSHATVSDSNGSEAAPPYVNPPKYASVSKVFHPRARQGISATYRTHRDDTKRWGAEGV